MQTMVEIITLQKCWLGGEPREPGYTTQMSLADAKYGESIGRLQIVVAEAVAESVEEVAEVVVDEPAPVATPAPKGKAAK